MLRDTQARTLSQEYDRLAWIKADLGRFVWRTIIESVHGARKV